MKPIKCDKCKMFYDGDKYENCPHCKASSTDENEAAKPEVKEPVFSIKKPQVRTSEKRQAEDDSSKKEHGGLKSLLGKMHKSEKKEEVVVEKPVEENKPEEKAVSENREVSQSKKMSAYKSASVLKDPVPEEPEIEEPVYEEPVQFEEPKEEIPEPTPQQPQTTPLSEVVKRAESTTNSANEKTVAFYNFSNTVEPVVGWLICVKGEYMGESFNLKSGRNNIGRALSMDIALAQEKSVSRERHASITFEPHKKKFYIQSGESSGLTYVNDELIMTFTELSDYDEISLGESKFIFLRLVGDKFSWENYS